MAEKWFIIEQFGKVGPFSLQDLLSGVERGDFDYSITIESEQTQQRTTLKNLVEKKKKTRRAKQKRRDAEATRIVPSESRHRNLEAAGRAEGGGHPDLVPRQSSRGRRSTDVRGGNFSYVDRRHRASRNNRKTLLLIPAMLAGGVLSLGLFYGLQKLSDSRDQDTDQPTSANIIDLPLEPEDFTPARLQGAAKARQENLLDIRTARKRANQTVLLGPLTFSRSELYRCRVKCKLGFRDARGSHITGVFFAEAFKNELLKRNRRIVVKGRISADGKEVYVQSIGP